MSLAETLEISLEGVKVDDRDAATVELARTYAKAIDDGDEELSKLGSKLLTCLESLLMTPSARAALAKKGWGNSGPGTSPIDELRSRRERRAKTMDPSTT